VVAEVGDQSWPELFDQVSRGILNVMTILQMSYCQCKSFVHVIVPKFSVRLVRRTAAPILASERANPR